MSGCGVTLTPSPLVSGYCALLSSSSSSLDPAAAEAPLLPIVSSDESSCSSAEAEAITTAETEGETTRGSTGSAGKLGIVRSFVRKLSSRSSDELTGSVSVWRDTLVSRRH